MGQSKLVILGTGGTIAGRADSQSQGVGYKAGQITVQSLLEAVPDLEQQALGPVQTQQIAQVDSKDMDWPVWRALLRACTQALEDADTRAVVITHGTDTLEETAWLLHSLLPATKPIVLTCAMRPATALLADGPQNLRDAVTVAASGGRSGVWVVAGGEVHAAAQVQKVHPYRLQAMRSVEGGPQALVEEGRVRWLVPGAPSSPAAPSTGAMVPATMSPRRLLCALKSMHKTAQINMNGKKSATRRMFLVMERLHVMVMPSSVHTLMPYCFLPMVCPPRYTSKSTI